MNENISKALVRAQAEMPTVPMNATNPFLKNRYADLGNVIETVRPVLAKHGLAFSQFPVGKEGEFGIKTILLHESGEFFESTVTLPLADEKGKSVAQVAGSYSTYLRRISLNGILGIYADEDNDGNQPAAKKKAPPETASTGDTRPFAPERLKEVITSGTATKLSKLVSNQEHFFDQYRNILAKHLNTILGEDTKRYELCKWLVGQTSTSKMTQAQVLALLAWLGTNTFEAAPSETAIQEAKSAHIYALKAEGQTNLL